MRGIGEGTVSDTPACRRDDVGSQGFLRGRTPRDPRRLPKATLWTTVNHNI